MAWLWVREHADARRVSQAALHSAVNRRLLENGPVAMGTIRRYWYSTRNGKESGAPIKLVDLDLLGVAIERSQAESNLTASHGRTLEILESINDAFYAVDAEWRFTYVNRKAEEWWGRDRNHLVGVNYWHEFPQAVGSAASACVPTMRPQ